MFRHYGYYFGQFVMQWTEVSKLSDSQFQRLVGVKRPTFIKMLEMFVFQNQQRVSNRGRPVSTSIENQLLIMLMYYSEYRTFFHIIVAYGISEAQCWCIVRKMETLLIRSKLFHLPGKKQLTDSNINWEVVVIDAGESPIERPKKTAQVLLMQKEKAHIKNTNSSR
jgi:Helix-turn-helix of DDE superfamily endonuclease